MVYKNTTLCIGDNSSEKAWAHHNSLKLAQKHKAIFRGQFSDINQTVEDGYYHTDLVSLNQKDLLDSIKKFNKIIILDQDIDQYSHPHIFVSTWKMIKELKKIHKNLEIINPKNMEFMDYWNNLLETNKSFCLYPWIKSVVYNDHHTLCTQSFMPVTKTSAMKDWKHDPNYTAIRKKMLEGEMLPNCRGCHLHEKRKQIEPSIREHETLEWAALLKLKSLKDLEKMTSPSYFELRFSNKCNIKCRSCNGHFSHLIQKENKEIKDKTFHELLDKEKVNDLGGEEIIDWKLLKRVYIGGGESTVQPELYKFLRNCIANNNTNFEMRIGTNGVKISPRLLDLFKHFTQLTFSLSTDGHPKIDEYIRWGTNGIEKEKNVEKLQAQGHPIAINFVFSIWNIAHVGETFEYFQEKYPNSPVHTNMAGYEGNILHPMLFPNKELALESIKRAMKTRPYQSNEQRTKSVIDNMFDFFSGNKEINLDKLSKFFYYNDMLDKHRGSRLVDYIPELEACRKYLR